MIRYLLILAAIGLFLPGCLRVKVDPVEVKPITLNVNLKIDRELDDFFAFEDEMAPAVRAPARRQAPLQVPPEAQAPAQPSTQRVPVREY